MKDNKWYDKTKHPFMNERTCPICKKIFFVSSEWVFYVKTKPVCSWSCLKKGKK